MGRIVVGVDGSPQAVAALRWACEEAARRTCVVEAVTAYTGSRHPADQLSEMEAQHQAALHEAVQTLEDALSQVEVPAVVEVRSRPIDDAPAHGLLELGRGAELLVVGTPGHGVVAGLLLGSVSQECIHHAPCPVVVVPSPHAEG